MGATSSPLTVTTRRVAYDGPLLSWLPSPRDTLSWVANGAGLVGWGVAARVDVSGPDRFDEARRWWGDVTAAMTVSDELDVPGSGPVAFASMAFDDDPGDSVLTVPEVLLGRRDGVTWITTVGPTAPEPEPVSSPVDVTYRDGHVDDDAHQAAVAAAVRRIRSGELQKVVLARDLVAQAAEPIDERYLLTRLAAGYPTCWVYAVDGLIGATPELLLRRDGDTVSARVLAGTNWPRPGVTDAEVAEELFASAKNRHEHEYAVDSMVDALRPYCTSVDAPAEPSPLHLTNVVHLSSDVSGTLADGTSLLDLTARVHPTAAVGGTPREVAVPLIRELERMDRGGYLGPVGWIDAQGNGEFGVALRCAQVSGDTARLFAGGGIVADSEPAVEAAEVAAKFRAMRYALGDDS